VNLSSQIWPNFGHNEVFTWQSGPHPTVYTTPFSSSLSASPTFLRSRPHLQLLLLCPLYTETFFPPNQTIVASGTSFPTLVDPPEKRSFPPPCVRDNPPSWCRDEGINERVRLPTCSRVSCVAAFRLLRAASTFVSGFLAHRNRWAQAPFLLCIVVLPWRGRPRVLPSSPLHFCPSLAQRVDGAKTPQLDPPFIAISTPPLRGPWPTRCAVGEAPRCQSAWTAFNCTLSRLGRVVKYSWAIALPNLLDFISEFTPFHSPRLG